MEKFNMTPDMLSKAKSALNAEALRHLAQTHHVALTEREAQTYLKTLHDKGRREMSEAELDKVAGGLLLDDPLNTKNDVEDC